MDAEQFDSLSRSLFVRRSRRAAAGWLGGLAVPLLGWTGGDAKKKRRKKRKKHKGRGKKPACTSRCDRCGAGDGCGGQCNCAAGSICLDGVCRPCDVVHNGDNVASGNALRQKLAVPLDDDSFVYVCPGRYVGYFVHAGGNLVGAGDGADPATNTILDLAGGSVPGSAKAVFAVGAGKVSRVSQVRVTGSTQTLTHGVLVPSGAHLTLQDSTVTGNKGPGVSGLDLRGSFELVDCTISDNGSTTQELPYAYFGGGIHAANTLVSDLIGCRITGNMSGGVGGGGVYTEYGDLNIFNTEITGNEAPGSQGRGGGIYQVGGSIVLRADTRITGNTAGAPNGGGGICRQDGTIDWQGPTVSGNQPNNCVGVSQCAG
ncbi:MAG: right-handed parallel beta-helix repeat-containing protein [Thermomicrobiales bacterium]|nr:right-handed parallel beta-helix repeat-containing protein [Thermomicrobiales bacterium]